MAKNNVNQKLIDLASEIDYSVKNLNKAIDSLINQKSKPSLISGKLNMAKIYCTEAIKAIDRAESHLKKLSELDESFS